MLLVVCRPDVFIETVGEPYESVYLDRKETKEGIHIFKVPYSLDPADAFIEADLGPNGKVVWSLG